MKKKLALLIALVMVFSLLPASALLAENGDYENGTDVVEDYDNDNDDENGYNGDEDEEDENDDEDYDAEEAEEDEETEEVVEAAVAEVVSANIEPAVTTPPAVYVPTYVPTYVPAPVAGPTSLRFVIGVTTFTRDGQVAQLTDAPFIDPATNRTMMPLAAFGAAIDADVNWNAATRTVSFARDGISFTLNADAPLPGGMGVPVIEGGRVFVPVAYVAQRLGGTTSWNAAERAVTIVIG